MEHLTRIINGLTDYRDRNRALVIDEPANDFEKAVNAHQELAELMEELKDLLDPLNKQERKMRDALAASLRDYFGYKLKEGVNNYDLSNFRTVKFTHKVDRSVDESMITLARKEFNEAPGGQEGVTFDKVLRIKYEVNIKEFRKVEGDAAKALARMIVSNFAAPTVKVD